MSRIFITGMGIISPIGHDVASNLPPLREGISGISHSDSFASRYASLLPFGQVKFSNEELQEKNHAFEAGITRTTLLALHAFKEALADSQLNLEQIASSETALIGATTVGGMCMTDQLYQDANGLSEASPYLSSYDPASVMIYLQERYQNQGIINTINTACSSSANAIAYGARLIKHGYAKRAIVGGVDSLAKFTVNGFNSMMILSSKHCRPFDKDRNGLNLGEGAAFLVLEKEEDCKGKRIWAELRGHGNANDAFHPSSLSDTADGPLNAMRLALQNAQLSPSDINFVNAHGTGTENNDLVESKALKMLFGETIAFTSTKSNTGHTLGAAGAIEAVYSILNLSEQELFPSLHFQEPIPETNLRPVTKRTKQTLQHVMSNSFGFGGNCSSLIFSKV